MADKWALHETLPDGLDETQAVAYREREDVPAPRLGGRWLVFEEQVWWQNPGGKFQRAIVTAADLEGTPTRWERVTA